MTSKLIRWLVGCAVLCMAHAASAGVTKIDLFTVHGVPGTGGATEVDGPCYCNQSAWLSPLMILAPGAYDFGSVREYWTVSGSTPDAGENQGYLWLNFAPQIYSGFYPDSFEGPPGYAYPSNDLCAQDDDACNASYAGAYVDFELLYTVTPDQNAVQIELIGPYRYTTPVPEPAPPLPLAMGLVVIAGLARWRGMRR